MTIDDSSGQMALTRTEVAAAIASAFGLHAVRRDALLECAGRAGARSEVVVALQRLPAREYSDLRQVWADLPDMAVR